MKISIPEFIDEKIVKEIEEKLIQGHTLTESVDIVLGKYDPLHTYNRKSVLKFLNKETDLQKLFSKENRTTNINAVGKDAQRIILKYNKYFKTKYTLKDFKEYVRISKDKYKVVLNDGTEISLNSRDERRLKNMEVLSCMYFGKKNIMEQRCPISGIPFFTNIDPFLTKSPTKNSFTFDLHHMEVSQYGHSVIKGEKNPSDLLRNIDLSSQECVEELTEFFGMIMINPVAHNIIHSEYSNQSHSINDYKQSVRPWAIRSETNYLKFFKMINLIPKYSFEELQEKLNFTSVLPKKRKKFSIEETRRRKFIKSKVGEFLTKENFFRSPKVVYEEMKSELRKHGVDESEILKFKSFTSRRYKLAKEMGWK